MRVTATDGAALVDLDGYGDLLRERALPDYRFVGPARVQVGAQDLAGLGLPVDVAAADVEVAPHLFDYHPSELRAGMENAGFHYHRRITIEKNPQSEATRNKETSLLHVTVRRNALNSFPQAGEYLLVFQTPGEPEVPVPVDLSFEDWCRWANSIWPDWATPTWRGIRETDVLNTAVARATPDERHVCPLQLGLIERVVRLWSNPGEVVLSPFAGIGSELYVARRWGRRGYGIELKESYYRTAVTNLRRLDQQLAQDLRLVEVDDISPGRPPAPHPHPGAERRPSKGHTAPRSTGSAQ